jgi:hypothetical protein
LALSETHCRADKPDVLSPIENYTTWNTERAGSDKGGGGLTILYRESLTALYNGMKTSSHFSPKKPSA